MSIKTLEEFEIPYFGRVELMHDEDGSSMHGKYWIRAEKYGIAGRFSESPEEAKRNGLGELAKYAQDKRREMAKKFNDLTSAVLFLIRDNSKINSQSTPTEQAGGN